MNRKLSAIIGIVLTLAVAMSALLTMVGCQKKAEEQTATQAVSTIVSPYEADMKLYKSVIDKLPEGAFYAFADMNEKHDALLVTEYTFADPDNGTLLGIDAEVYGLDKDGNIKNYGKVESGGTANPLMTKDHALYYAGHHFASKATIDEENSKLVVTTAHDETDGGDAKEAKLFDKLFDEYMNGTMVGFTKTTAAAAAAGAAAGVAQKAAAEKTTAKATTKKADTKKADTKKADTKKTTAKAATKKADTKKTTEATGSPVQRFQGRYGNGRCTIDVVGVANNTVEIHVYWSSSAWEHSEWTMSGNFDEDANGFYVYYSDGTRKDYKYNDDGEQESVETVYVGGKGSFRFNGNKMTWDDQTSDHIADGIVFTKS